MYSPPRAFFKRFAKHSACIYYRIEIPQRMLAKMYNWDVYTGGEWECRTDEEIQTYLTKLAQQDFVHYYASGGESTLSVIRFLHKIQPVVEKGEIRCAGSYFTDADDNIDYVNPINSRFKDLGTRMPNGKLLRPGEALNMLLPNGEAVEIWKDGKNGFDITRNLEAVRTMNKAFKMASGTSFTTHRLANYYKQRYHLRNVHVFPNTLILDDYPKIRLRKQPGKIRMLWHGGGAHYADFHQIKEHIEAAIDKYPELQLVVFGPIYPWIVENLPADRVEHHDWVDYQAFKIKLASIDFDFALVPLVKNKFNIFKSCIKPMEVAAVGKPSLVQEVPPYSDYLHEDSVSFFTLSNFADKLDQMIRDSKYRKELAKNSLDFFMDNYRPEVTIPPLHDWMVETRERDERSARRRVANRKTKKNLRKGVRASKASSTT